MDQLFWQCRAGENGRGFHTLFENEIAEGRLQKRHSNKQIPPEECQIISSRKNIRSYPEIAEEEAIWRQVFYVTNLFKVFKSYS